MNETTLATHTKGEWKVTGDLNDPDAHLAIESAEDLLANVYPPYATQRRVIRNANARLIAAAPDLLAALEAAVGDFDAPCPHCQGKGQIPGSKNWVAQGTVEASCWHCGASGKAVNLDWYKPAQEAIAKARGQ